MSRTYGKAQDLIDFTRASSGTCLRRVKYTEKVVNGTFDTDTTGWSAYNAVLSVTSGALNVADGGTFSSAYQSLSTTVNKIYKVTGDITAVGGGYAKVTWGNTAPSSGSYGENTVVSELSPTAFEFFFTATSTTTYIALSSESTFTVSYDNVSVKEVTFDTSDGDLVLFNHPNNIPRIEYDANGNLLGLLVEESRTNLIPYSDDFSASEWVKYYSIAVSPSSTVSPDGQQNAYELTGIESSDGDLGLNNNLVASPSTTYTASIWVKAANTSDVGKYVKLRSKRSGGTFVAEDQEIQLTSEWVRHSVTITLLADNTGANLTITKATAYPLASRADSCLIYRAQYEQGSFPTSAIPTSGSTATRSADVASLSTSAFGYNSSEGSVLVEVDVTTDQSGGRIFNFDSGSDANMLAVFISGDYLKIYNRANSTTSVDNALNADKTNTKVGYSFKDSYFIGAQDGTLYATNTTAPDVANDINVLNIMRRRGSTDITTGHIKSLKYYPRALTVGQIEELTS